MTTAAIALRQVRVPGSRALWLALLGIVAVVLYVAFAGQWTLPHDDKSTVFRAINGVREWVDDNRNSNIVLVVFITTVRLVVGVAYDGFLLLLSSLSWAGLTAIAAALGLFAGGWRLAALMAAGFLSFGVLGLWERSVETLAVTLAAVALSLAIGIPLGIFAGRSERFLNAIRPVLDFMQIMPTYAYLPWITLFFLIGPRSAVVATMIYAIPPAIRITALGIRGVPPASVEAARSLGSTGRQLLAKVQLPMARRTIILGVNQTIMMALSMVAITSLIDGPGLGKNILKALQINDVGRAFDAGVAIVIMAIVLDRLTTAASERVDPAKQGTRLSIGGLTGRRLAVGAVAVSAIAIVAGNVALGGNEFVESLRFSFRSPVNDVVAWLAHNAYPITEGIKNAATYAVINPLEHVLVTAPWWLVLIGIGGIAVITGGVRPAVTAAICLVLIALIQMWEHSMETLTAVLVATVITLAIGLILGIAAARNDRVSAVLRPFLDLAQTMPAFVYLLPAVALFGPTRFTGIIGALIFSIPPVIRLVEIGIRTVPFPVREASTAAGSTSWQRLIKVELPMAKPALLVAANQGIIMVLGMVVLGGLVGGGALGYDVVAGFARRDFFGEGLAAGIAIVLLGIMLDRITQGAGTRQAKARLVPAGTAGGVPTAPPPRPVPARMD